MYVFEGTITSSPIPHPERPEGQLDRVEPVADADAVLGPDERRKLAFERLDFGSENVPAAREDAPDGPVQLGANLGGGRCEIEEGDHQPWFRTTPRKSS